MVSKVHLGAQHAKELLRGLQRHPREILLPPPDHRGPSRLDADHENNSSASDCGNNQAHCGFSQASLGFNSSPEDLFGSNLGDEQAKLLRRKQKYKTPIVQEEGSCIAIATHLAENLGTEQGQ